jgi:nitrogen fixation/metabolism regulation signal transduction histidine kinase
VSLVTTIIIAVLGSGTVSIAVTRWFDRRQAAANVDQTSAETQKTKAETADILTQATERALNTMATQLATAYQHIGQLQKQQEQVLASLDNAFLRIRYLENRLGQYETVKPFMISPTPNNQGEDNVD